MKICIVAFSNLERDGRLLRQIKSMAQIAEVITIGYGPCPPHSSKHYSIPDDRRYLPIDFLGILSLLLRQFRFAYSHTQAVVWTRRVLSELQPDLIILNDVQTSGLYEATKQRTKVIIDMHEYAPEEMSDDWRFRILLRRYYTRLCAENLPAAAAVLTVSQAIATEFKNRFGVSCTVIKNSCDYYNLEPSINLGEKIRLVHAGLASKGRRLELMIDSVKNHQELELDLYLVPAPRQLHYYKKLREHIRPLSNVRLCEPLLSSELVARLNTYDVGLLIINPSNFSLANCLPNKLFEFIQARLMIVTGPTPDICSEVDNFDVGIVIEDFTLTAISDSLSTLNRDTVNGFKQKSNLAAHDCHFEHESQKLQNLVLEVLSH